MDIHYLEIDRMQLTKYNSQIKQGFLFYRLQFWVINNKVLILGFQMTNIYQVLHFSLIFLNVAYVTV